MNHFVYAMKSTDPAPAAGGETDSWFYAYKWNVGGPAFVPLPRELDYYPPGEEHTTLWFVMDRRLLGCVRVSSVAPSFGGHLELHYDTRLIQEMPEEAPPVVVLQATGRADNQATFDELKRAMDAQYPPRNHIPQDEPTTVGLPAAEV